MDSSPLTAAAVAARLGCALSTVTRAAGRHGIGRKHGRDWIFAPEDLAALRGVVRPGRGCPLFVPGNDLGTRRKSKA